MKPVVFLLCGLPGSGKTTRARELEAEGAGVLLNADAWVWHLYPDDAEAAARDGRKSRVEQLQWDVAERVLRTGGNVILDWGVWTREHRDECRSLAAEAGARVELIYLDAPLETLHERVARRNENLPPHTFPITPEELDEWATWFEQPTEDELA